MNIKIATLNIGSPSIKRAINQITYLSKIEVDIFIFTEVRLNEGLNAYIEYFNSMNWFIASNLSSNSYGVLIVSKYMLEDSELVSNLDDNSSRIVSCDVCIEQGKFRLIGIYSPPNDKNKNTRKKAFFTTLLDVLERNAENTNTILCGDFNTVDKTHLPVYKTFRIWEYNIFDDIAKCGYFDCQKSIYPEETFYSWFGQKGNQYKYDYFFAGRQLSTQINEIEYDKSSIETKLFDHSLVKLSFDFIGA